MAKEVPSEAERVLASAARDRCGFLSCMDAGVVGADRDLRLEPMLLRFDEFRAIVPAAQVENCVAYAVAGGAHLRDVSIPAGARLEFWLHHSAGVYPEAAPAYPGAVGAMMV